MTESQAQLPTPEQLTPAADLAARLLDELNLILLGRNDLHRLVLVGILSRGHILLEGVPGVGKTALVRALADLMQLDFKRVQFTPDLMPGDILGTHILEQKPDGARALRFEPGPVFTNLMLADEINRASPKTQSALLEAMQERRVTLLGTTRPLPDPFFVLASQNPIELEGTYPLPEAQLDRFLFKLIVTDVDENVMIRIIETRRHGIAPNPDWRISPEQLQTLFDMTARVFLPHPVAQYIARLVAATHPTHPQAPEHIRNYVTYGASPRAAIALAEAGRALALISRRPTVGFDDIKQLAGPVLNHRVILNYKARFDNLSAPAVIADLLDRLDETDLKLPHDITIPQS